MPCITAVTTSVGYADLQRHTLPSLCEFADRVIVVTAPGDEAVSLAAECGAEVIESAAVRERGALFNKSALVRLGQEAADNGVDDWLLLIDADTLVDPSQRYACNFHLRDATALYTCVRYTAQTQQELESTQWTSDSTVGLGYFQLYNPHGSGNPLYAEWSRDASTCDMEFKALFPQPVVLPFSVIHLGPAGVNWYGRVSPRWG